VGQGQSKTTKKKIVMRLNLPESLTKHMDRNPGWCQDWWRESVKATPQAQELERTDECARLDVVWEKPLLLLIGNPCLGATVKLTVQRAGSGRRKADGGQPLGSVTVPLEGLSDETKIGHFPLDCGSSGNIPQLKLRLQMQGLQTPEDSLELLAKRAGRLLQFQRKVDNWFVRGPSLAGRKLERSVSNPAKPEHLCPQISSLDGSGPEPPREPPTRRRSWRQRRRDAYRPPHYNQG